MVGWISLTLFITFLIGFIYLLITSIFEVAGELNVANFVGLAIFATAIYFLSVDTLVIITVVGFISLVLYRRLS